jgi:DNA-binding YbaB/EbfC family protein
MDFSKILKQAQRAQQDMQRVQAGLAQQTVEGTAAGGKVTVTATAAGDIQAIRIDPSVVDPADVEILEDLVLAAVRQALDAGRKLAEGEMKKVTAGMGLPPGMGF